MKINIGLNDLILIFPAVILFLFSLVPLTVKVLNGNKEPNSFFTKMLSLTACGLAFFSIMALQPAGIKLAFEKALIFDGVSHWVGLLIVFTASCSLLLLFEHAATKGAMLSEQVFLLLNSVVGMLILLWANDLIIVFIGIELMSLSLYILIALSKEANLSKEAAFKYFILGSFASAILLYGIAFVFGSVGTTYLNELTLAVPKLITVDKMLMAGMILVLVGFCFKISVFPFHMWTPDVYQGAPTPVTVFMATGVKIISFVALLRLVVGKGLFEATAVLNVLQWLAVLTMFAGNTAAILQNNFKRMLAYSSIAHSGYALIGIITAGMSANGIAGASGLLFYLLSYAIMTIGSFALVCLFEKFEDTSLNISDLKGLSHKYPVMSLMLTIVLISLAGLPPTLGFFGKLYLFSSAISEGLIWLAVWGVLNSVISVYYYLRPIVVMYMTEGESSLLFSGKGLTQMMVIISAMAILIIGLFSSPIFSSVQASVLSLF